MQTSLYFIPIITALLNRMVGGGLIIGSKTYLPDIGKSVWFLAMIALAGLVRLDPHQTAAWALTFACFRFCPTQGLFTAIHGRLPARSDQWYWPMQYVAKPFTGKAYGIVYGVGRGLICLIGITALDASGIEHAPWFVVPFLLQGVIYYLSGKVGGESYGSTVAELACGAMLGIMLIS